MKSSIPAPAIIAAVVVVLLVVVFFGWRALNTEPTPTGVGTNGARVNTKSSGGGAQPMGADSASIPGGSTKPAGQQIEPAKN